MIVKNDSFVKKCLLIIRFVKNDVDDGTSILLKLCDVEFAANSGTKLFFLSERFSSTLRRVLKMILSNSSSKL